MRNGRRADLSVTSLPPVWAKTPPATMATRKNQNESLLNAARELSSGLWFSMHVDHRFFIRTSIEYNIPSLQPKHVCEGFTLKIADSAAELRFRIIEWLRAQLDVPELGSPRGPNPICEGGARKLNEFH